MQKQNIKSTVHTLACGAWIGGTMTVPGVSGGSMAMILGIYISAPNNAFIFTLCSSESVIARLAVISINVPHSAR